MPVVKVQAVCIHRVMLIRCSKVLTSGERLSTRTRREDTTTTARVRCTPGLINKLVVELDEVKAMINKLINRKLTEGHDHNDSKVTRTMAHRHHRRTTVESNRKLVKTIQDGFKTWITKCWSR